MSLNSLKAANYPISSVQPTTLNAPFLKLVQKHAIVLVKGFRDTSYSLARVEMQDRN